MAETISPSMEMLPIERSSGRKGARKEKRPAATRDDGAQPEATSTSTTSSTSPGKRPLEAPELPQAQRPFSDRLARIEQDKIEFFCEELEKLGIVDENFATIPGLPDNFARKVREAFARIYNIHLKNPEDIRALIGTDSIHPFVALSPEGIKRWGVDCSRPGTTDGSSQCWTEVYYGLPKKKDARRPYFYSSPLIPHGMKLTGLGYPSCKEVVIKEKNTKPQENLYHMAVDVENPQNPGYSEDYRILGIFFELQVKRLTSHLMMFVFVNPLFQPTLKAKILTRVLTTEYCRSRGIIQKNGVFYAEKDYQEKKLDADELTHIHPLVQEDCFAIFKSEVNSSSFSVVNPNAEDAPKICTRWEEPDQTKMVMRCPVFQKRPKDKKGVKPVVAQTSGPTPVWPMDGFVQDVPEVDEDIKRLVSHFHDMAFVPIKFRQANGKVLGYNTDTVAPAPGEKPPSGEAAAASTSTAIPAPTSATAEEGAKRIQSFWMGSGTATVFKCYFKIYSLKKSEWGITIRFAPEVWLLNQRIFDNFKRDKLSLAGESHFKLITMSYDDDVDDVDSHADRDADHGDSFS